MSLMFIKITNFFLVIRNIFIRSYHDFKEILDEKWYGRRNIIKILELIETIK